MRARVCILENNPVSICMAVNRSHLHCIVVAAVVTLSVRKIMVRVHSAMKGEGEG